MVVGDEAAGDGLAGLVVVPDRGGQRQQPLHPHGDALDGPPAVAFQVKLALEGVIDRLDLTLAKLLILQEKCGVDLRVRCRDRPN